MLTGDSRQVYSRDAVDSWIKGDDSYIITTNAFFWADVEQPIWLFPVPFLMSGRPNINANPKPNSYFLKVQNSALFMFILQVIKVSQRKKVYNQNIGIFTTKNR